MRLVIFGFLFPFFYSPALAQDCLSYEPAKVTLIGHIVLRDAFGPPGYGEYPLHDEKRRNIILILEKPICVAGGVWASEPEFNVQEIQLALTRESWTQYQKLRQYVETKRRFAVRGSLYHQHTGYHVTNVLIFVDDISLEGP